FTIDDDILSCAAPLPWNKVDHAGFILPVREWLSYSRLEIARAARGTLSGCTPSRRYAQLGQKHFTKDGRFSEQTRRDRPAKVAADCRRSAGAVLSGHQSRYS